MGNPYPIARKKLANFSLHSKRLTLSPCALTSSFLTAQKKKNAKQNYYLLSSSIITKLANGLKRWQSLKDHDHAKDYAIKPQKLFIAFPFALIHPLWQVFVQSLKQFRYPA
jgi:hypothetical protein